MSESYSNNCARVFEIFEEISKIPRGSGCMNKIADYCVCFAEKLGLKYVCDAAKNVIIYKNASNGATSTEPVILQGHLDMVCQKCTESNIDFLTDPIEIYRDKDFIRAKGTSLGADNGIAVAMILSVLERDDITAPPIEAVFTTDEEVGMLGAIKLDTNLLNGKKLINLDSEEDDTVTVSCAGGSDFKVVFPVQRIKRTASEVQIIISGLKGGHSGIEINKHRVNAATLAGRILSHLSGKVDFNIISVNSGNKANAIPNLCEISLACENTEEICKVLNDYTKIIAAEIAHREPEFKVETAVSQPKEYSVFDKESEKQIIYALNCAPNGITEMSSEISGLVETSLNLGILCTEQTKVTLHFALRSNKYSALKYLEDKLTMFFSRLNAEIKTFGHYPPWEYKEDSILKTLYVDTYTRLFHESPKVEAIHAGLECAIFSSSIKNVDCIAIGPTIYDAHTVNEALSISSTEKVYELLLVILSKLSK